jgi:adenosylhomocysteinase
LKVKGNKNFHIKERWVIEIDRGGEAKINIITKFKNVRTEECVLANAYEFIFREGERPDYFLFEGKSVTPDKNRYNISLNIPFKADDEKTITIEMAYARLVRSENDWWTISLTPKHGSLSPHELVFECYLPMEAEDIRVRAEPDSFKINEENKKVTLVYTGPPYFLKLSFKFKKPKPTTIESTISKPSFSKEEIEKIKNSMPLLCHFADAFSKELKGKPFYGKAFLIALHFLKDLIVFLEACEKLGLNSNKTYLFWKPYVYPHKDLIVSHLRANGYENTYPINELGDILENLDKQNLLHEIIILEDGGYISPLVHSKFKNLLRGTIGAVEQTTKGIRDDEKIQNISIPILNVAQADIKIRIEPPYIADAVVQSIKNLLSFEKLRGRKVALLGCGVIGKEIREKLRSEGLQVTVYDPREEVRIEAQDKGYDVSLEPYNAVKDKFLVIGCSGQTSISRREILSLKHKTYLVSASSDQLEIDIPFLESISKDKQSLFDSEGRKMGTSFVIREKDTEIRLLGEGYPINFYFTESMPNQVSDLVLSMILLSALELARDKFPSGIQKIDKMISKYKISELYESYYRE